MSWSERRRAGRWLAVVAWGTTILLLSTESFAGERTGAILLPLLRALLPGAPPETLAAVHAFVRKTAHFTEYAVFAVLLVRALAPDDRPTARHTALAVLLGALLAVSDEVHQACVPARTGAALDVLIDVAGVGAGAALGALLATRRTAATPAPASREN